MARLVSLPRTRMLPLAMAAMAAGCAPAPPGVSGVPATAARPDTLWAPPAIVQPVDRLGATPRELPRELEAHRTSLTLEDVVALALEGSPDARAAWAAARARAAAYGEARGSWFPELTGEATATRIKTAATQGRSAVRQTIYEPSASFTWLLLDMGGRTGGIRAAREALVAADWTHNATLQNVVARAAGAYFDHAAAKALLAAQQITVREAETNLAAAEERRKVGVATIADVLQARTALSQARLDLQAVEGNLLTTRGALAVATGFPANLEYDIDTIAVSRPPAALADSVDSLITLAVSARPDLAAARAEYDQARAQVQVAGAARLPSITANGNTGLTFQPGRATGASSYTLTIGLQLPLFNGFAWEYARESARWAAEAARARAVGLRQQVVFEVFSSYYALRTATVRVGTADELLASAAESADAARGRYQAGVGSLLELLNAENALAAARAQRIQARLGWQAAMVQLSRDVGLLDLEGRSPLHLVPAGDSLP